MGEGPVGETEKIELPKELVDEAREAAEAQQRPVDRLFEDAVRQYLDDHKWQTLVESGQRRAQAKGFTEDDVPRLVAEARTERRR